MLEGGWQIPDLRSSMGLLLRLMKLLLTSTFAVGHLFILWLEDPVEFKDGTKGKERREEDSQNRNCTFVDAERVLSKRSLIIPHKAICIALG